MLLLLPIADTPQHMLTIGAEDVYYWQKNPREACTSGDLVTWGKSIIYRKLSEKSLCQLTSRKRHRNHIRTASRTGKFLR